MGKLSKGMDVEDIFNSFMGDLQLELQGVNAANNIMEFLEKEVDMEAWLGPGGKLNDRQVALLKSYDGIELTADEVALMQAWAALDRTSYDINLPPRRRQAFVLECGRSGGKTFLGAIIIGYEWYKLCMMDNPQQFFGVAASTLISIYCLAPAASQVKKTIFGQAKAFLNYIPKVKRLIDSKLITVGEEQIKYDAKLLYIYAGNSKGSSQVGSRVLLLVMDEVARFENKDGDSNALELWSNVGVSGITFGEHARRVAISSAWADKDAIQRLWIASKGEDSWVGFRFRTWDLNPVMNRQNPIIAAEYNLNPAGARLEFEGDRTFNSFTFFDELEVNAAFTGYVTAQIKPAELTAEKLVRLNISDVQPCSYQTYMHLDPAVTQDAYGMAYGHGEQRDGQRVVIVDGLAVWQPDAGNVVSMMNVHEVIHEVHCSRPLYRVTADHAQQHETLQRLRHQGIAATSRFWSNRVQVEIYDFLRKLLHEGRIVFPKNSPWTSLLKIEMMGVVHNRERNKIEHPKDGSKDLLDAVAAIAWEIAGAEATQAYTPKMIYSKPVSIGGVKDKLMLGSGDSGRKKLVRAAHFKNSSLFDEFDF